MKAIIAKLMCALLVGATIVSPVEAGWQDDIARQSAVRLITDGTDVVRDANLNGQSNRIIDTLKRGKNFFCNLLDIRKHDEDRFDWYATKMIAGYGLSSYCIGMGLAHLLQSLNVYKAGCLFVAGYAALRVSANGYKKLRNFAQRANMIVAERAEREAILRKQAEILKKQKEDRKKCDINQID